MTEQDAGDFMQRMVGLAEVFDKKLTTSQIGLYFEALRDIPVERVLGALNEAVRTCTFFPRPVEIRTLALGAVEDLTEHAWLAFRAAVPRLGYMASVIVDDAALGETITAMFGGWAGACAAEFSPEMWASKRKEFGRVYQAMRRRQVSGSRYLPGHAETQNAGRSDWMRFVPGGRIGRAGDVQRLSAGELDAARLQLAAATSGFSQIDAASLIRLIPAALDPSTDGAA